MDEDRSPTVLAADSNSEVDATLGEADNGPALANPLLTMPYRIDSVGRFTGLVERLFARDEIESFWNCESAFRDLIEAGFANQVLNAELQQLVQDPYFQGDWRPKQLMVARGSGYALAVSLFDSPRRYIHSAPFYGLYSPLGTVPLSYERYALPPQYRNEVFDPAIKLEPAGTGVVTPGEVLRIESTRYVYDFIITEPVLVAKFTCAQFHTLEWLFSRESLHAWQANDSELSSTQLRVAAYLLGRMAHQFSLEPLIKLTEHPHHSVRWAAIQSLGRMSRAVALEHLEKALSDRHPHIRRAAEKTLKQLRPAKAV